MEGTKNAMRSSKKAAPWAPAAEPRDAPTLVTGRLVAGAAGELLVDLGQGPRRARRAARLLPHDLDAAAARGAEVLILLEAGDSERPVVIDFVVDPAAPAAPDGAAGLDMRLD